MVMDKSMQDVTVILGFDFGMKYIGVACGQTITNTATPLTALRAVDGIPDWAAISALLDTWRPTLLIVGNPLNMDDSPQEITYCAKKFANRLQHKFKLPVEFVDERLSTWEAKHQLGHPQHTQPSKQLVEINANAAALLIQQWLQDHLPD